MVFSDCVLQRLRMVLNPGRSSLVALLLLFSSATVELGPADSTYLKYIANVSYAADSQAAASMFSPRMDFDQWKPLTGRGDPLRNDPTYDYEPPVLERVRYWADETRLEREHYPEKKSEVLMLGISSRRPSASSRPPSLPPQRHSRPPPPPPPPPKYEDYSYKLSDTYHMTILVPPPPPPPGHEAPLFILKEEKNTLHTPYVRPVETSTEAIRDNTVPEHLTSLYDLQESNLVYQSSTTTQNWIFDFNRNNTGSESAVSSEYAGWGPTTPIEDTYYNNDTYNFIITDYKELSKHPYSFYKPMLSESPPAPPQLTPILPTILPTFVPTALPLTTSEQTTVTVPPTKITTTERPTTENYPKTERYYEDTTPESTVTFSFQPSQSMVIKPEQNIFDMMGPMMSMPLGTGPERPEDNLYAHATENLHVFKEPPREDIIKLENMQTMQPPPIMKSIENVKGPYHVHPNIINSLLQKDSPTYNHDVNFHMRFTTPTTLTESTEKSKPTAETPPAVPYLIIQGHSKVKTYSSKPKDDNHLISNEIPKPYETTEVKHLHPIKDKTGKKTDNSLSNRKSRAQSLKSLVETGVGSVEIQEADVGIKYDISDGSEVPIEVYRKGIVDSDENDYSTSKKNRVKRQADLFDFLPFDEDDLEDYIFKYLNSKRNETGITGMIAKAVTSDAADVVDDLEDDDEDNDR